MFLPAEDPAVSLKQALDELQTLHASGAGGRELARRRADIVDLALISLFRQAEHQVVAGGRYREPGLAVVAVGGYGRRELCPFSDVDLMLLYRPDEVGRIQEMAEYLFYPLWDAGLELGHGARTVEECLRVAEESLELETSFLQARLLVGDQDLFRTLVDRLRARIDLDDGRSFVLRLQAARDNRREDRGPAGALLEPDLKEGRGGLRDVHEVLWAAAALRGASGIDGLASTGWLDAGEIAELEGAVDVLLSARTSLHYVAGRKVDRLHLDYQEDVATLAVESQRAAPEVVMARVFSAAQSVGFLTEDAWAGVLRSVGLPSASTHPLPEALPETVPGRRALLTELAAGRGRRRAPSRAAVAPRGALRLAPGLGVDPFPGPA